MTFCLSLHFQDKANPMSDEIKNIKLSLCCQEDWNGFKSMDERTRFCDHCQHRVIDFTHAKKSDLDQARQSGERVCGRFKMSQMDPSLLKYAAASIIALSLTSGCTEEANLPSAPAETIDEFIMGDVDVISDTLEVYTTGIIEFDSTDVSAEVSEGVGL